MLLVAEALSQVLAKAVPLPAVEVPLAEAGGLVLAEDVSSDIDSPPHDKALMDGYAVVAGDLKNGQAELDVVEEVVAGAVPSRPVRSGTSARIMTGAPIPPGADAVVMVEETQPIPGGAPGEWGRVKIASKGITPGKNIMPRGKSMRAGEQVLTAGSEIRSVEVGLLAEVGRTRVRAHPRPTIAILPTGDEIVEPDQRPAVGQIRNSNGPMLAAFATRAGAKVVNLGIARDRIEDLRQLMARGLEYDMLLLSGGVSAGVRDLVPEVLAELGVEAVFHKVRLRPGKPLLFGTRQRAKGPPTIVFGLPGNPVSGVVCAELFVRPAIRRLAGFPPAGPQFFVARLATEFVHRGDRPTYHPGVLRQTAAGWEVSVTPWEGSADLRGVTRATGLVHFPAGDRTFRAGESVDVLPLV